MNITAFIDRVAAQCPSFGEVSHILTSSAALTYPAALIGPVEARSPGAQAYGWGTHVQTVTQKVGVYIVLERRQDGLVGHGVAEQLEALCAELQQALVGWMPAGAREPVNYLGGTLTTYADGLFCWREEFSHSYEIRIST